MGDFWRAFEKNLVCHTLLKLPSKIALIRFNGMYHIEVYVTHNLNEETYHKLNCLSAEIQRRIKPTLRSL